MPVTVPVKAGEITWVNLGAEGMDAVTESQTNFFRDAIAKAVRSGTYSFAPAYIDPSQKTLSFTIDPPFAYPPPPSTPGDPVKPKTL